MTNGIWLCKKDIGNCNIKSQEQKVEEQKDKSIIATKLQLLTAAPISLLCLRTAAHTV